MDDNASGASFFLKQLPTHAMPSQNHWSQRDQIGFDIMLLFMNNEPWAMYLAPGHLLKI